MKLSSRLHKSPPGRAGDGPWLASMLEATEARVSRMPLDIVRQARERAEAILQEGVRSAEKAIRAAREQGFEEGRKQGQEAGLKEAQSYLDEARRELDMAKRQHQAMIHEAEPEVAKLAVQIARVVLKREISLHPDAIVDLVRDALARATGEEVVTVRTAPGDTALLEPLRMGLETEEEIRSLRVEGDPALEPGDCILETPRGTIDERLPVQLERVAVSFEAVDRHG